VAQFQGEAASALDDAHRDQSLLDQSLRKHKAARRPEAIEGEDSGFRRGFERQLPVTRGIPPPAERRTEFAAKDRGACPKLRYEHRTSWFAP